MKLTLWLVWAVIALSGAPAEACRGRFAEEYLIWQDVPALQAGEIAIEIDMKDAINNRDSRDIREPAFKVKKVLVGTFTAGEIRVAASAGSCSRDFADGAAERFILVGRLSGTGVSKQILIPRYMKYGDPIHIAAQALASSTASKDAPR